MIYRQQPKVEGADHFGSRLVFGRDGTLFVTQGDRFELSRRARRTCRRPRQDRADQPGRLGAAGQSVRRPRRRAAGDLVLRPSQHPGAALHPETGQLWTVEHGARGGDELNRRRRARTTAGR